VLESVHPPILTIASFFAAPDVDARAGQRALFLMPNSFVAMRRDRIGESLAAQSVDALWAMFPAIVLAGLLAWRVMRAAKAVGLSGSARVGWALATLAFGLPAYITYRLTRPTDVLVTCANCGRARRPDYGRCHHCNSPWRVPELVPPAWRVLGESPTSVPEVEPSEKDAIEPEQNPDSSVESM
jgi:hypothetical protein